MRASLAHSRRLHYFCAVAAIYFISDLHFGLQSEAEEFSKEARLLDLFEKVSADGERLYILGDLFDFWFEYRHVIPAASLRILTSLRELSDTGVEVHYLAGNHDFALGPYLSDQVKCITHLDPFLMDYRGVHFFLHHGDGMAGKDAGYRILKRVLRSRLAQGCWRWIHPDIGMAIARAVSRTSRNHTEGKDYGTGERASRLLAEYAEEGLDYIIMGHTHLADDRILEGGCRYINLGSWLGGGAPYARFEEGRLDFVRPDGTISTPL